MELTYDEIIDILHTEYIAASSTRYTHAAGIYEISDIDLMLKSLLPDEVKVNLTFSENRLRSSLTTNKIFKLTKISFFYTILCFTQSHSGPLDDIEGFFQLVPGS